MIQENPLNLEAMILAGGKGTRLQEVINDRPKPMAEVSGRPFLEWILISLRNQGVRKVILCTGYMGDIIEDYFKDGRRWDIEVQYSLEYFPLGTGGAVRQATDRIENKRFLILNGDSYSRFDLYNLLNSHIKKKALMTMGIVNVPDCRRYGQVKTGDDGAVLVFQEKSSILCPGLINAGIYLIEREVAEIIPEGMFYSLESDFFPGFIGCGLYAFMGTNPFLDIGIPESLASATDFIFQGHI